MSDGTKSSGDLLIALQRALGEAMRDPKLWLEFAGVTRDLREETFPRGTRSIQEIVLDGHFRFKVDAGDRLGADVYFGSLREMPAIVAFCRALGPGDRVIDAGANFGLVSIMAADRVGVRGRVLAFEPDRQARALLEANIKLNRVKRRVTVVPRCLSDTDGILPFYRSEESAFSGLADTGRARIEEVESVPAQRLDTAMEEFRLSRLDALKIDVEGFEYAVLAGAIATLDRAVDPLVMLEVSPKNLDAERRPKLVEVLEGWLEKGWEFWSYAIERNEFVSHTTAHQIVDEAPANLYLAKPASARLQKVRQAYEEIVANYLLPAALRRQLNPRSSLAQSAHSASQLLWNAFLIEISQGFQGELRKLEAECHRQEARAVAAEALVEEKLAAQGARTDDMQRAKDMTTQLFQELVSERSAADARLAEISRVHEEERSVLQREPMRLRAEHEEVKELLMTDLTSARSDLQRAQDLATQLFQELLTERNAAAAGLAEVNRMHENELAELQRETGRLRDELERARALKEQG